MPTLTPSPRPAATRGLNHYDGAPLILAATPAEALTSAEDRAAARAVRAELARIEGENRCARARLRRLAKEREEARRLAAPPLLVASTITPERPSALTPDKREKVKRAHLLRGANTRECARIAADSMTARKLFPSLPEAMQALARQVSEATPLPDAAPEDILSAWMLLDPLPLEP